MYLVYMFGYVEYRSRSIQISVNKYKETLETYQIQKHIKYKLF